MTLSSKSITEYEELSTLGHGVALLGQIQMTKIPSLTFLPPGGAVHNLVDFHIFFNI